MSDLHVYIYIVRLLFLLCPLLGGSFIGGSTVYIIIIIIIDTGLRYFAMCLQYKHILVKRELNHCLLM